MFKIETKELLRRFCVSVMNNANNGLSSGQLPPHLSMFVREYTLWYTYRCVCTKKNQTVHMYVANVIFSCFPPFLLAWRILNFTSGKWYQKFQWQFSYQEIWRYILLLKISYCSLSYLSFIYLLHLFILLAYTYI